MIIFAVAQALASQITVTMGVNDIGTRSVQSPALFTPPGFTFAIWGVIFLGMLAYAIFQALHGKLTDPRLRRIGWWTASAMALNASWELVTVETGVSVATVMIIFAMLATLLAAFFGLYRQDKPSGATLAFVIFPVSIFTAWITVASIANTSSWLGNAGGFDGGPLSDGLWVAILAIVGSLVGAVVMRANRANIFYALVLVWAFGGIAYKGVLLGEIAVIVGASAALILTIAAYLAFARRPARTEAA
ncbi:hypothetical protein BZG35_16575 [Brevundimonas sp. LM2]|nr:hypothetical protein BZG35_16575 [Brevundimonas sp. LM2]